MSFVQGLPVVLEFVQFRTDIGVIVIGTKDRLTKKRFRQPVPEWYASPPARRAVPFKLLINSIPLSYGCLTRRYVTKERVFFVKDYWLQRLLLTRRTVQKPLFVFPASRDRS